MTTNNDVTLASSGRGVLAGAVVLGVANSLWALFQWAELLLARQGGTPFCSVDETFNCAQVWDSAFAVAVHDATQIPIAGWGLAWGIIATLLPLGALVDGAWMNRGLSSALRLTALAGVASIVGLGVASYVAGALCLGCIGTYALVAAWTALAWRSTRDSTFQEPMKGALLAGGLAVVLLLGLLVPGMRTPHAEKKLALAGAAKPTPAAPSAPATPHGPAEQPAAAAGPSPFDGPPTGDPVRDDLLERFVVSLDEQTKQVMSDLLQQYRDAKPAVLASPRTLVVGDARAPVRVTDWTDPLCPHCAMLHETLGEIAKTAPPGLFSVESRHFPLDGFCNPGVQRKSEDGARCIGALAQICLEGDKKQFEASGALFAARAQTVDAVYDALKPFRDPAKLKKCIESAEAKARLQDDIAAAMQFNIEGTPLVLLNGREVRAFGPLVYALILTGGADKNAAFRTLPPPRPQQEHPPHAPH